MATSIIQLGSLFCHTIHSTIIYYISSSSSSWTQFLEMSSISHICLSPPIFLFVFLFIFHICRLTCPIFFSQFPTSNWSPCAAICIVVVQLFPQNIPSQNILQNLLRIGSNALQWRVWPLHKPTGRQRSFITSQYSSSFSDIHLRSQYRVICNEISSHRSGLFCINSAKETSSKS